MNNTEYFSLIQILLICFSQVKHRTFPSKSRKSRVSRCVLHHVLLYFVSVHINQSRSSPKRRRTRS